MKSRPVNNGNENMASVILTCAVTILFVLHSITAQCHKVMPFFPFFSNSSNYYSKFFAFESCVYMFSYPLVRISHLDNAFSKTLELIESPIES